MKSRYACLVTVIIGGLILAAAAVLPLRDVRAAGGGQQKQISYAQDLVPIFRGYCVPCHQPGGEGYKASGVDLRTYEGLMKGTKYGPVVIPYEPDNSSLLALIEGLTSPQIRMPFGQHELPSCLQLRINSWIFQGAKNN